MKTVNYPDAVLRKGRNFLFFIIFLLHLFTADYDTNGILAAQPFNLKNIAFFIIGYSSYLVVKRRAKDNYWTGDWVSDEGRALPYALVLVPIWILSFLFMIFVVPKIFGYECLEQIPTLWLGFKP